ncbi:uncharacterized protein LOC129728197 [Wyeomyia smithii]|uniref:uncharacterized protein LOC129728197 n=1 Tax=Wyeomyia smithii TaxID=174621 RepID=UPI002467CBE6|nr:uncharacterized protein LOC129728197 [Wyeomyia smithii]
MIKIIEKIQSQFIEQLPQPSTDEEWIQEQEMDVVETQNMWDTEQPYRGISLEEIIEIDRVFERTADGVAIMEVLRENKRLDGSFIRRIGTLLCDCLQALYGCRPNNFHKNQIAVSLVQSYPALAATSEVPQGLWFHAHARGLNRHAGRLYYRMEYLARKSEDRVFKRRRLNELPSCGNISITPSSVEFNEIELEELILELKYIVPNQRTRARIFELWEITFVSRHGNGTDSSFSKMFATFPVLSAYKGELIGPQLQENCAAHGSASEPGKVPRLTRKGASTTSVSRGQAGYAKEGRRLQDSIRAQRLS